MKIAVTGKGGVGKTLIAGTLARCLSKRGLRTIAIDADPSPNLALTLGLSRQQANGIKPISENKELIESKTETGYSGVYRLTFSVDDVIRDYSVSTPFSVGLVVMGTIRSMGAGCTCAANAVVRALLRHLVVERNEAVVLDMEAGVEHMGRATARHVDAILIVADANLKSLEIARHIYDLANKEGMKNIFLVGNKVANENQREAIERFAKDNNMNLLDCVPFDQRISDAEMQGETPLQYDDLKAIQAIEGVCEMLISKHARQDNQEFINQGS